MNRYFIKLAFDGTTYHGWQIQENARSVQEELQQAMTTLFREKVEVTGCGRTDAGVHARDFYAHFELDEELDEAKAVFKLNSILPKDIGIYSIQKVKHDAHARFSALSRRYHYCIARKKDPFLIHKAWYFYPHLDLTAMNEAAKILFEYNDFSAFSKSHTQVKTNICKIMEAKWVKTNHQLIFTVRADRFLRNMVRAIVGTLVEAGQGKCHKNDIKAIVESKNRSRAGASVPACGLYLSEVEYSKEIFVK